MRERESCSNSKGLLEGRIMRGGWRRVGYGISLSLEIRPLFPLGAMMGKNAFWIIPERAMPTFVYNPRNCLEIDSLCWVHAVILCNSNIWFVKQQTNKKTCCCQKQRTLCFASISSGLDVELYQLTTRSTVLEVMCRVSLPHDQDLFVTVYRCHCLSPFCENFPEILKESLWAFKLAICPSFRPWDNLLLYP